MADRNDIRDIWNNAAWQAKLPWTEDGVPIDLTNVTAILMRIKASAADADPVLAELSLANGRIALSATPTDGQMFFRLPLSVTATLVPGRYVYDVLATFDGDPEPVTRGSLEVIDGVS